jgi:hypothetical protein
VAAQRVLGAAGDPDHTPSMSELTILVVAYCAAVGFVFLGLWLWYDRRDHHRFEMERRKTTFHCIRCDALYTAPVGADLCACPKCSHQNSRLRF